MQVYKSIENKVWLFEMGYDILGRKRRRSISPDKNKEEKEKWNYIRADRKTQREDY